MTLSVTIWDVQHGSAAYIRTPDGKHIVLDLGVGSSSTSALSFSPLRHLYYNYGVRRLDEVIISHPHRDHLDDIGNFDLLSPRILRRPRHLSENDIRAGNRSSDSSILDKYFEIDTRFSSPVGEWEDPERANNNGGVDFAFFTPTSAACTNLNNHSIVTFCTYAGLTICIPGDNEAVSWRELLAYSSFQQCLAQTDILVAAHHGREAGYCEDIFTHCKPHLVIASDGPISDTSAIDKYGARARGWLVHSRRGNASKDRRVLTTRCDGVINIECYVSGGQNFLVVTAD